jgi:hypothetical protein
VRFERESWELSCAAKNGCELGVEQDPKPKTPIYRATKTIILLKRGQSMKTTTAVKSPAKTASRMSEREPLMLQKRIGSTVYSVSIRFSDKVTETLEDKLLRMIEGEVSKLASHYESKLCRKCS